MVFQILVKIEVMQKKKKNRLFGCNSETEQHFFFQNCLIFIVHTYMVQISLQNSGGKVVFLKGEWFMEPPMGTNGSESNLVT